MRWIFAIICYSMALQALSDTYTVDITESGSSWQLCRDNYFYDGYDPYSFKRVGTGVYSRLIFTKFYCTSCSQPQTFQYIERRCQYNAVEQGTVVIKNLGKNAQIRDCFQQVSIVCQTEVGGLMLERTGTELVDLYLSQCGSSSYPMCSIKPSPVLGVTYIYETRGLAAWRASGYSREASVFNKAYQTDDIRPVTQCVLGKTYESTKPTLTSDRVCSPCSIAHCDQSYEIEIPCNMTHDTRCVQGSYPYVACTKNSATLCIPPKIPLFLDSYDSGNFEIQSQGQAIQRMTTGWSNIDPDHWIWLSWNFTMDKKLYHVTGIAVDASSTDTKIHDIFALDKYPPPYDSGPNFPSDFYPYTGWDGLDRCWEKNTRPCWRYHYNSLITDAYAQWFPDRYAYDMPYIQRYTIDTTTTKTIGSFSSIRVPERFVVYNCVCGGSGGFINPWLPVFAYYDFFSTWDSDKMEILPGQWTVLANSNGFHVFIIPPMVYEPFYNVSEERELRKRMTVIGQPFDGTTNRFGVLNLGGYNRMNVERISKQLRPAWPSEVVDCSTVNIGRSSDITVGHRGSESPSDSIIYIADSKCNRILFYDFPGDPYPNGIKFVQPSVLLNTGDCTPTLVDLTQDHAYLFYYCAVDQSVYSISDPRLYMHNTVLQNTRPNAILGVSRSTQGGLGFSLGRLTAMAISPDQTTLVHYTYQSGRLAASNLQTGSFSFITNGRSSSITEFLDPTELYFSDTVGDIEFVSTNEMYISLVEYGTILRVKYDPSVRNCSGCPPNMRITAPCSGNLDDQCEPCEPCNAGYYIAQECYDSFPHDCQPCPDCSGYQRRTRPCGDRSSGQCSACSTCLQGFYANKCHETMQTCKQCVPCNPKVQITLAPCGTYHDYLCAPYPTCPDGTYATGVTSNMQSTLKTTYGSVTVSGSTNAGSTSARFAAPTFMAVYGSGYLYIIDGSSLRLVNLVTNAVSLAATLPGPVNGFSVVTATSTGYYSRDNIIYNLSLSTYASAAICGGGTTGSNVYNPCSTGTSKFLHLRGIWAHSMSGETWVYAVNDYDALRISPGTMEIKSSTFVSVACMPQHVTGVSGTWIVVVSCLDDYRYFIARDRNFIFAKLSGMYDESDQGLVYNGPLGYATHFSRYLSADSYGFYALVETVGYNKLRAIWLNNGATYDTDITLQSTVGNMLVNDSSVFVVDGYAVKHYGIQPTCKQCTACGEGRYANVTCTAKSDAVCTACPVCSSGYYLTRNCSGSDPGGCTACRLCGTGQWETSPCTPTSNRACLGCGDRCLAINGVYESQACSGTQSRRCSTCSTCGFNEFYLHNCTDFKDTDCETCKTCDYTREYMEKPCNRYENTKCAMCTVCPPGYKLVSACTSTNDTRCSICPAGKYITPLDRDCQPCPVNSTSASGSTSIADCNLCAVNSVLTGSVCTACPANTYRTGIGSFLCEPCPPNSISPYGSMSVFNCTCKPGYFKGEGTTCKPCDPDKYGQGTCTNCPINSYSKEGSSSLDDCVCDSVFYKSNGACVACASGTLSLDGVTCASCPNPFQNPSAVFGNCKCPANTYGVEPKAYLLYATGSCYISPFTALDSTVSPIFLSTSGTCRITARTTSLKSVSINFVNRTTSLTIFNNQYYNQDLNTLFSTTTNQRGSVRVPELFAIIEVKHSTIPVLQVSVAVSCTSCPPHSTSTGFGTTDASCVCDSGYQKVQGLCVSTTGDSAQLNYDCLPGFYKQGEDCFACPANTFNYETAGNRSTCLPCYGFSPEGSGTVSNCKCYGRSYVTSTGCVSCPSPEQVNYGNRCVCRGGYYWSGTSCQPCAQHYYSTFGINTCAACPANSGTLGTASVSRDDCLCNAGYYKRPGYGCTACPGGKYQPYRNDTLQCQDCPERYTNKVIVVNGKYEMSTTCSFCAYGTQDTAGCPYCTNTGTNITGSTWFTAGACQDYCAPLGSGYQVDPLTHTGTCICKAGYYQSGQQWVEARLRLEPVCTPAEPGFYVPTHGMKTQLQCIGNTYQSNPASTACLSCMYGAVSDDMFRTCRNCTTGEVAIWLDFNTYVCVCGRGYYTVSVGNCVECPVTKFNDLYDVTVCFDCPAGIISSATASTSFLQCNVNASTGLPLDHADDPVTYPAVIPDKIPAMNYFLLAFTNTGTSNQVTYTLNLKSSWVLDILVVGGGGGSGCFSGGGGGGGVLLALGYTVAAGNHTIVVGKGGAAGAATTGNPGTIGVNGYASSFGSLIAAGGGGGAGRGNANPWPCQFGNNGGCGGGGSTGDSSDCTGGSSTLQTYTGVTSYGNAGGRGNKLSTSCSTNPRYVHGGGGGAGGIGEDGVCASRGGNGGVGVDVSTYFGTRVGHSGKFAGGGGGAVYPNAGSAGTGGLGGGGVGGYYQSNACGNGMASTGGGAGGGPLFTGGCVGGSGVVLVRYRSQKLNTINSQCPKGMYSPDLLTCVLCPANTFKSTLTIKRSDCKPCNGVSEAGASDYTQCVCGSGGTLTSNGCTYTTNGACNSGLTGIISATPTYTLSVQYTTGSYTCICAAGGYGNPCLPCPQGFYNDLWSSSSCEKCPVNMNTVLPASKSAADCKCDRGYAGLNNVCIICPANTYKDWIGDGDCISCPSGMYSQAGSSSKASCGCNPGYGGANCSACPVGFYQQYSVANLTCTVCTGSAVWHRGLTSAQLPMCPYPALTSACPSGFYYDGTNCSPCIESFEPAGCCLEVQMFPCVQCMFHATTMAPGMKSYLDCTCVPGYYRTSISTEITLFNCTVCEKGTYKEITANIPCTSCDLYATTPGVASSSRTDCTCNAGFTGNGWDTCDTCPEGTYFDPVIPNRCLECPSYSYSLYPSYGPEDCFCIAGYQKIGGTCLECPINTYKPYNTDVSSLCIACPNNTVSGVASTDISDCVCKLGYTNQSDTCVPCDPGTYKPITGNFSCVACPELKTTDPGAILLSSCRCIDGYRTTVDNRCELCPNGTYLDDKKACVECPDFSDSPIGSVGKESCACNAGYVGFNGDFCTICKPGTFKNGTNPGSCDNCPSHMTSDYAARSYMDCFCLPGFIGPMGGPCEPCSPGTYQLTPTYCTQCPDFMTSPSNSSTVFDCYCLPGYVGYDGYSCTACPTAKYQTGSNPGICEECPFRSTSAEASYSIASCGCIEGFYGPNGTDCLPCKLATYKGTIGDASCTRCPTYALTKNIAATSADECLCGPGLQNSGSSCTLCPAGKYKSTISNEPCTTCPSNSTSPIGSTVVQSCKCDYGSYNATINGIYTCKSCPAGKYYVDGTVCASCPPYKTSPVGSYLLSQCVCKAGYYGGYCTPCAKGTFANTTGASICLSCPANMTSLGGSESCTCDVGYMAVFKLYQNETNTTTVTALNSTEVLGFQIIIESEILVNVTWYEIECQQCPAGKYKSSIGNINCSDCPLHSTSLAGSTLISQCQCEPGYVPTDSYTCVACKNGTYEATVNARRVCKACPVFSTSEEGSYSSQQCTCFPGYTIKDGECIACPAGTYDNSISNNPCIDCPANTSTFGTANRDIGSCHCNRGYTPTEIAGECRACTPGYYKETVGNETCKQCPYLSTSGYAAQSKQECGCSKGTFGLNGTECVVCTTGKYKDFVGEGSCRSCPSFSTSDVQTTDITLCVCIEGYTVIEGECTPCPQGSYKNKTDVANCEPCPEYATTTDTGSTSIFNCSCSFNSIGNVTHGCIPCPTATFVDPTGTECIGCPTFSLFPEGGTSLDACQCIPGYTESAVGCSMCTAGKYKAELGNAPCTTCPSYSTSPDGSSSDDECVCIAGYTKFGGICVQCDEGKFKQTTGDQPCTYCQDYATSLQGSNSNLSCVCNAGYQGTFELGCSLCPPGTYSETGGQSCKTCFNNSFSAEGSTSFSDCLCSAGYGTVSASDCQPCDSSGYRYFAAFGPCDACMPNSKNMHETFLGFCECSPGYYVDANASAAALNRRVVRIDVRYALEILGLTFWYSDETQTAVGSLGVTEYFQLYDGEVLLGASLSHDGAGSVYAIEIFTNKRYETIVSTAYDDMIPYPVRDILVSSWSNTLMSFDLDGSTFTESHWINDTLFTEIGGTCQPCPPGTFKSGHSNVALCDTCPPRSTSGLASIGIQNCQCETGFVFSNTSSTCETCPEYTYYDSAACNPCPFNGTSVGDRIGIESCQCAPGLYGTGTCMSCPLNTYKPSFGPYSAVSNSLQAYMPSWLNDPALAVDSDGTTCALSQSMTGPYLRLDMGSSKDVAEIEITGCTGCTGSILTGIEVRLANSTSLSDSVICAASVSMNNYEQKASVQCNTYGTVRSRYVYIAAPSSTGYLRVCSARVASSCTSCPPHSVSPLQSTSVDSCVCAVGHTSQLGECVECGENEYKAIIGNQACVPCLTNSVSTSPSTCECRAGYTLNASASLPAINSVVTAVMFSVATWIEGMTLQFRNGSSVVYGNANRDVSIGLDADEWITDITIQKGFDGYVGGAMVVLKTNKRTRSVPSPAADIIQEWSFVTKRTTSTKKTIVGLFFTGTDLAAVSEIDAFDPTIIQEQGITCVSCAEGSYKASPGNDLCTQCPQNTWTASMASESFAHCLCLPGFTGLAGYCSPCPEGSFKSTLGGEQCSRCPEGTYNPQGASTSLSHCLPCPDHSTSPSGSTQESACQCLAGFTNVSDGVSSTCEPCPRGTYKTFIGNSLCTPCHVDTYNSQEGSATPLDCLECQPHSSSDEGAEFHIDCMCDPGYHSNPTLHDNCGPNNNSTCIVYGTASGFGYAPLSGILDNSQTSGYRSEPTSRGLVYIDLESTQHVQLVQVWNGIWIANRGDTQVWVGNSAQAFSDNIQCDGTIFFTQLGELGFASCDLYGRYVWLVQNTYVYRYELAEVKVYGNLDCVACEAGKYKQERGWNECTLCPLHSTHPESAKTNIFACECGTGYTFNPSWNSSETFCMDLDECQSSQFSCSYYSSCSNIVGDYGCQCDVGWTAGSQRNECVDVNECLLTNTCNNETSTCENIIGTYQCPCRPGFEQLSTDECFNIDECSRNAVCMANTVCHDTFGAYTCDCDAGFHVDSSGLCVNTNECLFDPCPSVSTCVDFMGSFYCDCNPGYTSSPGGLCNDVNECTAGTHDCDPNAACTNTEGSFSCECTEGWKGTGTYCECKICSPCPAGSWCFGNEIFPCPNNSHSANNSDSREDCICDDGYYDDTARPKNCSICPVNHYCYEDNKFLCPDNSKSAEGSSNRDDCICDRSYHGQVSGECVPCPENYYCPGEGVLVQCPPNSSSPILSWDIEECSCDYGFIRLGDNILV